MDNSSVSDESYVKTASLMVSNHLNPGELEILKAYAGSVNATPEGISKVYRDLFFLRSYGLTFDEYLVLPKKNG
jgi:hypothetical protein